MIAYRNTPRNFNPLPPHGGRHSWDKSDTETVQFQSTPSAWRETVTLSFPKSEDIISIHSLRMEGDCRIGSGLADGLCISIHSLRMEGDTMTVFSSV